MKRARYLALVMLLCLLFSGCGKGEAKVDEATELRVKMLEAAGVQFTADIRCDFGDRVWDCSVSFSGNADGASMTVQTPESIAGLELRIEDGGAILHYDGASLDLGDLLGDGASAAEAIPLILNAWQSGYVADCYGETIDGVHCTVLLLAAGTDRQVVLWFDEAKTPIKAEIQLQGETRVFCTFQDFAYL